RAQSSAGRHSGGIFVCRARGREPIHPSFRAQGAGQYSAIHRGGIRDRLRARGGVSLGAGSAAQVGEGRVMIDQVSLLVSQTILISLPLILAALGGASSERSGVVNIALEGILLSGAFAGAAAGYWTQSATVGVIAGVASGVLISLAHAVLSIWLRAD